MSEIKSLCASCSKAVRCHTWAEWKCTAKLVRYSKPVTTCDEYTKRPAKWEEKPCQCEDCLKNELLMADREEE